MFEEFTLERVELPDATLRVRHGGSGPPVLLLHGHPRTHTTWYRVAPLLAEHHTVVCPDLRGYGQSSKPADTDDHGGMAKRALADDMVALMAHLGHRRFAVVGHDRGSYVAFRLAMDHPEQVSHLAFLGLVPIGEALERANERFARLWWHWFFFGQPKKPERAILADPDAWYGNSPEKRVQMGAENYADYYAAVHDPATVHAMLEDYRAGLGIDREHDAADREAGRSLRCPTLVLWPLFDDEEELYADILSIWRPWAADLRGHGLRSGHHLAEEVPEELAAALLGFLNGG
ncbi:alpha/beta fold hydrolase [Deinococcus hopiensis]|uniref:Haloacetate dehalogenase n=1 Tax=Deinococcus hopiensis KR-140 TaxID=695939 RepID=A0A1W1V0D8_9DEIO|nr:alpha/beta hydrolase [Deinococcus hopiensis]SMB86454.1 haloacetate dehalogenase [Deinococcus hopiensis KR-140]